MRVSSSSVCVCAPALVSVPMCQVGFERGGWLRRCRLALLFVLCCDKMVSCHEG